MPFFFLLLDSFVLSPCFPESVCAACVVFVVPEVVAPLVSVPVATAASPLFPVAGAADVDSPGVAELDHGEYPKGIKVSDKQIRELEARAITRHDWHGEWNYTVTGPPRAP